MLKMTPCNHFRISVAVLLCLLCPQGVTAQNVLVESSPKPSCPEEPLVFNCSVDFPSLFIRWDHMAFTRISLLGGTTFVGNSSSTSGGRVVAELTMREDQGGSLFLLASTITIYPPLNDLNNIKLNNTNIKCDGSDSHKDESAVASIVLEGNVSSPVNLTGPATNSLVNATIEWDPPLYSGRGIVNYMISIATISYVRSETGTSHTIQTNVGSGVEYYDVHVTAISVCGSVSEPANYSLRIQPSVPPMPSLDPIRLMCSVDPVRATLQWQYGISSSLMYTPPTDSVTVKIRPVPPSPNECDDVSPQDMTCSFNTTSNTTYTVEIYVNNSHGPSPTDTKMVDSHPLLVNDSGLKSNPPYIDVSLSGLCQDGNYTITVQFGVRSGGSMGCYFQQNVTAMNGRAEAPSNISQGDLCYRAVLGNRDGFITVVDGGESVPTSFPKPTSDSRNNHGLILGVCLGLFSWYVSSVSNIAVHFYWFLPVIAAGLSLTNVLLYSFGFIFSVVVFPIGVVLWILSYCGVFSENGDVSLHTSYSTPHNSTMSLILHCIGVVTSIIIFPFGIIVLIFYFCGHKCTAKSLLTSFGIVGAVIVPPIGLVLFLASCFCEADTESCKQSETKTSSPKEHSKYAESRWTRTVVKIGIVGSVIVFPVGIFILSYHLNCGRPPKEKDLPV